MQDHELLHKISDGVTSLKVMVEDTRDKVRELNGRSITAIEKLAKHEERFESLYERMENLESVGQVQQQEAQSEKFLTKRDLKVVSVVAGGLYAVVQAVFWTYDKVKLLF